MPNVFDIKDEDGERHQGCITTMLNQHGDVVHDVREAVQAIGYIMEGPRKGLWLRFAVTPENWKDIRCH